jgi:hypothetical protein
MLCALFKHRCCMSIYVVYTQKSWTQLLHLNNAQYLCLSNINLWNNKFQMDLQWTHETCKFVMYVCVSMCMCVCVDVCAHLSLLLRPKNISSSFSFIET